MPASGAAPDRLLRYAARARRIDEDLRRVAPRVGDPELAAAVIALADREATTTGWVRSVGEAFRQADAASGGAGGGWVAGALAEAYLTLATDGGDAAVAAVALGALLASRAPPAAVAGAGRALGPTVVDELARTRPDLIGPADGMPLAARFAANRRLVRAAWRAEGDPSRRDRLGALLGPDAATGRARQVLLFEASGDGRVAEVFGDPATASSLVVVVPGVGTDLGSFDQRLARPVAALAEAAEAAQADGRADRAGGGGIAAVAWLGYDPPDGLAGGPGEVGALLGTGRAGQGGRALVRLLGGLPAPPGQRRTLVGHSYGSTTVAAALAGGAEPDHVVVMGSPGVLVDRAALFGLPDTTFHVLAAPGDPVVALARLGRFGGDPAAPGSGFTPLTTGVTGHSRYLEPGSRSQANVAAVVAGTEPERAGPPR